MRRATTPAEDALLAKARAVLDFNQAVQRVIMMSSGATVTKFTAADLAHERGTFKYHGYTALIQYDIMKDELILLLQRSSAPPKENHEPDVLHRG